MKNNYLQKGFSLIELAIVLFILSLLLGTLLSALPARLEQEERAKTQELLDEILEVLYGFTIRNTRLPCPDCRDTSGGCAGFTPNDGVEDPPGGAASCATEAGNLPWVTLGVTGVDEWGNNFTYAVDDDFADTDDGTGCSATPPLGVSFAFCSDGNFIIRDSDGGSIIAEFVPAVIVSHGKNWTEVPSAHEEENYEDPATYPGDILGTFVSRDFSNNPTDKFDDMLIWVSPYVLRKRMLDAGILP